MFSHRKRACPPLCPSPPLPNPLAFSLPPASHDPLTSPRTQRRRRSSSMRRSLTKAADRSAPVVEDLPTPSPMTPTWPLPARAPPPPTRPVTRALPATVILSRSSTILLPPPPHRCAPRRRAAARQRRKTIATPCRARRRAVPPLPQQTTGTGVMGWHHSSHASAPHRRCRP